MRKVVIVAPELLGATEETSVMRQSLPALNHIAEHGELKKLAPLRKLETPEALYLGLSPSEAQMRQGPLTISALGADPPERSTHFHLSLVGLEDWIVRQSDTVPSPEELRLILEQVSRLNTKALTFVQGEDRDHGLVWEGLGDLRTYSPSEATEKPLKSVLPEGDAERILRRYIDDSTNLLNELELNERRVDEGLPPLNLLWPWGHGTRVKVPNLALRRGEPAMVISESMRMQGLVRLSGYRHVDRLPFRKGINFDLQGAARRAMAETAAVVILSAPAQLRAGEKMEELEWFAKRMDEELLEPLWDLSLEEPTRIALFAPSQENVGLALLFEYGRGTQNIWPFDERAFEERLIPVEETWKLTDAALD